MADNSAAPGTASNPLQGSVDYNATAASGLANDLDSFPDSPPDSVCIPCLLKSFGKGFMNAFPKAFLTGLVVGALAAAAVAAGIVSAPALLIGGLIIGGVLLAMQVAPLVNNWNNLTPSQRAEQIGQITGGVVGGAAGGAVGAAGVGAAASALSEGAGAGAGDAALSSGANPTPDAPVVKNVPLDQIDSSQGNVSPTMRDGQSISDVADNMRQNGWDSSKDPPDMVQKPDGRYQTLDHRRLVAADQAGLDNVPARVHHPDEPIEPGSPEAQRFANGDQEPSTWGEAAQNRSLSQRDKGFPDFPATGRPGLPPVRGGNPPPGPNTFKED